MKITNFSSHQIALSNVNLHYQIGGEGTPLVMLHGFPQTHYIWHKIAPTLAKEFLVIMPDLRGYGDSSKPKPLSDHSNYSKRTFANDIIELVQTLGHNQFLLVGHDRGARVAHRLALDHPKHVKKMVLLDIVPTFDIFAATNKEIAMRHYHWFFLSQPPDLPEKLLLNSAEYYLTEIIKRWCKTEGAITKNAISEYLRCFKKPGTIRAMCEDYRAAATIDLEHDKETQGQKLQCPLLILWGKKGAMQAHFDVLQVWKSHADNVIGYAINCGHFLPEEAPEDIQNEILKFMK